MMKIGDVSFWYADIGLPETRRPALQGDTTGDVASELRECVAKAPPPTPVAFTSGESPQIGLQSNMDGSVPRVVERGLHFADNGPHRQRWIAH